MSEEKIIDEDNDVDLKTSMGYIAMDVLLE